MNKIIRFYTLTCLLALTSISNYTIAAIVKGHISDKQGENLEFVSVSLTLKNDKSIFLGSITDSIGNYVITNVAPGEYILEASFIGYQSYVTNIKVTDKNGTVSVKEIVLKEDAKLLDQVEVIGQASQMRFDIDKKVFNVDQNLAASGASASEMLQNIPSVEVDNEGNVSLRNSSSVEVWINGKPSGLTEDNRAQILEQMPAGSIESVEVITNPSAKFNPEGTAGIINLVLKKDRKAGYYGSVSLGGNINIYGKPEGNVGANFNYNSSKVDFYANVGFRLMNSTSRSLTDRYSFTPGTNMLDTVSFLNNTTKGSRFGGGLFARMGADFHLDKKNTLSISFMGHGGMNKSLNSTDYTQITWAALDSTIYNRSNSQKGMHPSYHVGLDYLYEIDSKGSEIRAGVSYGGHKRTGDYYYTQTVQKGDIAEYNQIQRLDGRNHNAEAKVDYTQKFGTNMKLEAGLYGKWDNRKSPSRTWNEMPDGSQELEQYNDFNYNEWIGAFYATYGAKFGGFSMSAGLRTEYTNTTVSTRANENDAYTYTNRHYWEVYHTVSLSYTLKHNHELQANYTRRINRPRGRQLNSFRNTSDSTNIEFGNPLLDPEISSAVEINYIKSWEEHVLSASIYYRFSDTVIERVLYLDDDNVMYTTFENISKRQSLGIELVSKNKLCKWINLTTTVNGYYSKMNDVYYDTDLDGTPDLLYEAQDNFSWDIRLMANFIMPMNFSAQLTGGYRSPQVVAQGTSRGSYSIDLGVRKSFLNKKLNLALSVRDVLNSRRWANTTYGDNFWQYSEFIPRGTTFSLTLTYNFGNTQGKRKTNSNQNNMNMSSDYDEMGDSF